MLKKSWISKISTKMENCKTFFKAQTAIRFKEIIQPSFLYHQIKPYNVSETKVPLWRYLEIYRHWFPKCLKNAVFGSQEMMQC